ncbi:cell division protein ZapA [Bianquea renquensis]|jgi:hypothetical protein|uniref:Cell division protein ZapA n=1 Tax=Bianquea renquensis TaxID=2763661 RepID=A0A926DVA9_9FIRM|nr:cell division protein ZapA [Bianquea renquensis]MBC8544049.1 cell division protein ZapA [Bianquea renquensis]
MGEKRRIEVNIGGYVYKLMGEESEEHMQQVAMYIDEKIRQVQKMTSAQSLSRDYVAVLASINVADDFLKLLEHVQIQQERMEELTQKSKELEDKLDEYQDELMSLEQENLNYRELVEELQLEILRFKEQGKNE